MHRKRQGLRRVSARDHDPSQTRGSPEKETVKVLRVANCYSVWIDLLEEGLRKYLPRTTTVAFCMPQSRASGAFDAE